MLGEKFTLKTFQKGVQRNLTSAYLIFAIFFILSIYANFVRKCALKNIFKLLEFNSLHIEGPYFTDNQSGIL